MARIYEWFHSLFDELVLIFLHLFIEHVVVSVTLWDATSLDARLLYTHEHLVVLKVQNFAFQLELLCEIRNNQSRCDFALLSFHLAAHENLIEMVFDSLARSVLRDDALKVKGPCFEALVVLVSTHILVKCL